MEYSMERVKECANGTEKPPDTETMLCICILGTWESIPSLLDESEPDTKGRSAALFVY